MTAAGAEHILVVDDDDTARYLKTHMLRRYGYIVSEAASGGEALRALQAQPPHLVLLDVKLPDMSGIEVCRRIKASSANVVVLQTSAAFVGPDDRTAALQGGADSYLIEPIEAEELAAVVNALLRMRAAEAELRALNQALEQKVAERTRELIEANRRLAAESSQRAKVEEALHHAQKLEAIGQLTGGIAHDFNNLLTVVLANFEMIERDLERASPVSPERILKLAASGRRAAEDCEHMTRQLLAFARRDAMRQLVVDVNETIRPFEAFLHRALGETIALNIALAPDAWSCRLDPNHLEASLLNLTVNARDAMPSGGTLTISTANVDIAADRADGARVYFPEVIAPGQYLQLAIADTGVGMDGEVVSRAFEPFFTTKDIGKGSGLGLSQVYGFVKQSGGYIAVDTAPGAGTTFTLFLPRCRERADSTGLPSAAGAVPRGGETVLVVEDNEMVLYAALEIIEELGYRVLHATDADGALAILAGGEAIDLLFTDVVMPNGMSGIELARAARRRHPCLPVLLASGYAAHEMAQSGFAGEFPAITKPYRRAELATKLRQALDTGATLNAT
jgi:CheY-like chemotaxis protein